MRLQLLEFHKQQVRLLEMNKPSCGSCQHFSMHNVCKKFDAKPPDEVIQSGCDDWVFDEIPF